MGDCRVDGERTAVISPSMCRNETHYKIDLPDLSASTHLEKPKKFVAKRLPQYFAALAAHISGFALGAGWFWAATGVPGMVESGDLGELSKSDRSWITSAPMLGALIGTPITGYCLNRFGRRNTLMIFSVPGALSWFVIAFSTNIPIILVGRVIVGVYCGLSGQVGPLLIAESVEASFRGMLMCMFEFVICIGTLYVYIIGSYMNWQCQAIAAGIIPVIGFITLIFVPESPYYLMEKGDVKGAIKSLCWLRGASTPDLISEEIAEVSQTVKSRSCDSKVSWREMLQDPGIWKPIMLSIALLTFFQTTYINLVLNTTVEIFQSAGSYNEYFSTIIIGIIQIIATLVPMTMSDKFGRRVLLLVSLVLVVISYIGLGLYFKLRDLYGDSSADFMNKISWMPLTFLIGYIIACSIGIVPLSWVITAEIAPPKAKGLSSGIVGLWNRLVGFAVIFTFWDSIELLGNAETYWMIAGLNLVAFIIIYAYVPETKGKTLEEIQSYFEKSSKNKTKM